MRIFSTDHKVVGVQYALTSLAFLLLGFLLIVFVRWQLAWPEAGLMLPEFYNQLGAMHGTVMVFLAVVPLAVGGFGNYLVPIMIGALTPTEVWRAHQLGSDVVKLFPGSAVGPDYVKALRGPFPHIPLMPTGGVDEHNVGDWFRAGVFAVGAGSQLSPGKLAKEGRFDEIEAVARRFVDAVARSRCIPLS